MIPYAGLESRDDVWPDPFEGVTHEPPVDPAMNGRVRPSFADRVLTRAQLADLPKPEPLIEDVLDRRSVALLIGPWGSMKSFIGLDWSASVATGRSWQGREVCHTGRVLYVAAEGANGLNARVEAWEYAWAKRQPVERLDVYPGPVNLLAPDQVAELAGYVGARGDYALVVLDTIARCMVGGDENSARDMGLAVDALHRIKDATAGGVALGIHHTGKDRTAGARGSSALESGVDTVYAVDKLAPGVAHLRREKRKDGPTEDTHDLELLTVSDSCVVQLSNPGIGQLPRNPVAVSSALSNEFAQVGASASVLAEHCQLSRSSTYAALNRLLNEGIARKEGKGNTARWFPAKP